MKKLHRIMASQNGQPPVPTPPHLEDWLDLLEGERTVVIQRLRQLDRILVSHGRLKNPTLPTRRNR